MERLQTPQKILGILSSVNFPPLLVENEVTQPRANDRQEGRRASHQLRLSPPFPGPEEPFGGWWGLGGAGEGREPRRGINQQPAVYVTGGLVLTQEKPTHPQQAGVAVGKGRRAAVVHTRRLARHGKAQYCLLLQGRR